MVAINVPRAERKSNNSCQVIAIVYKVSRSGSIACMTTDGMIGHPTTKSPRYFRDDRQLWNKSTGVLNKGMRDLQDAILSKDFDESEYSFINLSQAQLKFTLGIHRCSCKGGCRSNKCSCKKMALLAVVAACVQTVQTNLLSIYVYVNIFY